MSRETAQDKLIQLESLYNDKDTEVNKLKQQLLVAQDERMQAYRDLTAFRDKYAIGLIQEKDKLNRALHEKLESLNTELTKRRLSRPDNVLETIPEQ